MVKQMPARPHGGSEDVSDWLDIDSDAGHPQQPPGHGTGHNAPRRAGSLPQAYLRNCGVQPSRRPGLLSRPREGGWGQMQKRQR